MTGYIFSLACKVLFQFVTYLVKIIIIFNLYSTIASDVLGFICLTYGLLSGASNEDIVQNHLT